MEKEFSFGKVDGYGNGRKSCEVTLRFGFYEFGRQEPYFSVRGYLWNHLHSDCLWCGQCVDGLAEQYRELKRNTLYSEMLDLWKQYHLKKKSAIPAAVVLRIEEILKTA